MKHVPPHIEAQPVVPVVWRRQFFDRPKLVFCRHGMTIGQIIAAVPELPRTFPQYGYAYVDGQEVDRSIWWCAKPKPRANGEMPEVFLDFAPQNGGGSTQKTVLATVATIAILLVSGGIAAGGLAGALGEGTLLANSWGARIAAAAFAVGGALAMSALTPPPSSDAIDSANALESPSSAGIQGNVLRPGGPVLRVCGTRKVFPPIVVKPLTELIGDDLYVTAAMGLAGPHELSEIRADALLDDIEEVEYETKEGWGSDTAITLITRQSRTDDTALELSAHKFVPGTTSEVDETDSSVPSKPYFHTLRTFTGPDEFWLNLAWPQGLVDATDFEEELMVPVRVMIRRQGTSDWVRIPELHFVHKRQGHIEKDIRFKWVNTETSIIPDPPTPPTAEAPCAAYNVAPMRVDTAIGDFTNELNAFNGVISEVEGGFATIPQKIDATDGFIGADFSAAPRTLRKVVVWPAAASGFATAATQVTVTLWAKSGTEPSAYNDGTQLATSGLIDDTTSPLTFDLGTDVGPYDYYWVSIVPASLSTVRCADLWFLGDPQYSWYADPYFSIGNDATAPRYMDADNIDTTDVENIALHQDKAIIYLDTSVFPKGRYDVKVMRGAPGWKSRFDRESYTYDSDNSGTGFVDFFDVITTEDGDVVPEDISKMSHKMVSQRRSSIWNEHPLPPGKFATIAVKVRNRQLPPVSCIASGYVRDWNATSANWLDWTTTDNPAPHLRDILGGELCADPIPSDLLDHTNLVEFRQHCIDEEHRINAVMEGRTGAVAAALAAACGYARLRQSETWGVIIDRDRYGEAPVQSFSPRNSRGYRYEKAFPRPPDGFRCIYADADNDYAETELIVLDPEGDGGSRLEEMRYDGYVTEEEVEARALFDLKQMRLRMAFHFLETNAQAIKCQRGDLIEINHPVLKRYHGSGYVDAVLTSGSDVTGVRLDGTVPIAGNDGFFSGPDSFIDDLYGDGLWGPLRLGAVIRLRGGAGYLASEVSPDDDEPNGYGRTLMFDPPISGPVTGLEEECLVHTGPLGEETRRMIVHTVTPKAGQSHPHQLVLVDEAPELFAA